MWSHHPAGRPVIGTTRNPAARRRASAAYAAAVEAGLEIVHPLSDEEWGVRRFFFADRAGNVVNVLTHRT